MTSHLTFIALDIARERAAEARNERLAAEARTVRHGWRPVRPGAVARLRIAASALAGNVPETAGRPPRSPISAGG